MRHCFRFPSQRQFECQWQEMLVWGGNEKRWGCHMEEDSWGHVFCWTVTQCVVIPELLSWMICICNINRGWGGLLISWCHARKHLNYSWHEIGVLLNSGQSIYTIIQHILHPQMTVYQRLIQVWVARSLCNQLNMSVFNVNISSCFLLFNVYNLIKRFNTSNLALCYMFSPRAAHLRLKSMFKNTKGYWYSTRWFKYDRDWLCVN